MATLNDFKVVKAKSQRMFEFLEKELHLSPFSDPNVKARLGFYHLVLESVTQNPNIREISEAIIDQEYNDKIYHIKTDDLGIDAVYIYTKTEPKMKLHYLILNTEIISPKRIKKKLLFLEVQNL